MSGRVLIVEDEKLSRVTLTRQLEDAQWMVEECESAYAALEKVRASDWDVVITDLRMPGMDGLQLLKEIKLARPETVVIMITGYGTVETAVAAMKEGALDYVTKPFQFEEMLARLEKAMSYRALRRETIELRRRLECQERYHRMIGTSPAMRAVFEKIAVLADRPCTVLIQGETGTGKELVAEALHAASSRREGPLVKVSCFALGKDVLESELFGHEKGAFTGAIQQKRGRFELAHGGTIFLDDIEDVPLAYQPKLLRVLQERTIERVGGEKTISVDVRVIAATKKDLRQLVREGRFREDLLFRILGAVIELPPLRERQEDIMPLITHFLEKHGQAKPGLQFSEKAVQMLFDYHWPGNVRELEHVVEQGVSVSAGPVIEPHHLPRYVAAGVDEQSVVSFHLQGAKVVKLPAILDRVEETLINWALTKTDGHQGKAADLLGVPRTTLRQKMAKFLPQREDAEEDADERVENRE
ncbi:MAG: sigma-54-dependent Fis family transcriptional regulator [Planctomycetes bacterium]|nr:sigma-54-dependent Fis family transcriptional regulator [Planctomycetota bacterium]